MNGGLAVLLICLAFLVGTQFGVLMIGGWRQFRWDILDIRREDLWIKERLAQLKVEDER